MTVVEAIADTKDIPPTDLPQLNDVIDPDALNRLSNNACSITFEYGGYRVTVRQDAEVILQK